MSVLSVPLRNLVAYLTSQATALTAEQIEQPLVAADASRKKAVALRNRNRSGRAKIYAVDSNEGEGEESKGKGGDDNVGDNGTTSTNGKEGKASARSTAGSGSGRDEFRDDGDESFHFDELRSWQTVSRSRRRLLLQAVRLTKMQRLVDFVSEQREIETLSGQLTDKLAWPLQHESGLYERAAGVLPQMSHLLKLVAMRFGNEGEPRQAAELLYFASRHSPALLVSKGTLGCVHISFS